MKKKLFMIGNIVALALIIFACYLFFASSKYNTLSVIAFVLGIIAIIVNWFYWRYFVKHEKWKQP